MPDSTRDTNEHINNVRRKLHFFIEDLEHRAEVHDRSKLEDPIEKAAFDIISVELPGLTYGSEEYKAKLREVRPAIQRHYRANDHHPEHFPPAPDHEVMIDVGPDYQGDHEISVAHASCGECDWTESGDESDVQDAAAQHERETHIPSGVHAMALPQLVEMLCDWKAASERHDDGDIRKSIKMNAERFEYGEELTRLMLNTCDYFGWD